MLVAAGKLRLPKVRIDVKKLLKIPTGSVAGNKGFKPFSPTEKKNCEQKNCVLGCQRAFDISGNGSQI
jgi:hypothetical protein